jgi:hypothetical protein
VDAGGGVNRGRVFHLDDHFVVHDYGRPWNARSSPLYMTQTPASRRIEIPRDRRSSSCASNGHHHSIAPPIHLFLEAIRPIRRIQGIRTNLVVDARTMTRSAIRALLPLAALLTACATAGGPTSSMGTVSGSAVNDAASSGQTNRDAVRGETTCTDCGVIPIPADVTHLVESRISVLKARGGECSRYGSVLEQSYRSGRITLRPYMWRVGRNLASGEAKPNGDMTLALEIDSLNVGIRTADDVVFSMEHEAVHIRQRSRRGTSEPDRTRLPGFRANHRPSRRRGVIPYAESVGRRRRHDAPVAGRL